MIARRADLEPLLYDFLRESFDSDQREGIHLSSLISPRQTFFKRVKPKPITDAEIGFFSSGRSLEDVVERMIRTEIASTPETEIEGIHLRPDFFTLTARIFPITSLIEFKSRRSNLPETDEEANEEFSHYRAQMRGYMALYEVTSHFLVVLSLFEGKTGDKFSQSRPVYAVYEETMTPEELAATRLELFRRRDGLRRAFDLHELVKMGMDEAGKLTAIGAEAQRLLEAEFTLMPLCEAWLCGKRHKTIVKKAKCETCNQEFDTEDFGPRKHVTSKKGAGHIVEPAQVEWHYEPRCQWYDDCRPWEMDPERGATSEWKGQQDRPSSGEAPERPADEPSGAGEGLPGEGAGQAGVVADGEAVPGSAGV